MSASDERLVRLGRGVAAFAIIASLAGLATLVALRNWSVIADEYVLDNALLSIGFGIVTWVAVPRHPRNGTVWVLAATSLFTAVFVATAGYLVASLGNPTSPVLRTMAPHEFPTRAVLSLPMSWVWIPGFFLLPTLGLLLFPDGRFASRLGRVAGWLSVVAITLASAAMAWTYRPSSTVTLGADSGQFHGFSLIFIPASLLIAVLAVYSLASAVRRYRHSDGETRQQFRWVLAGTGALVLAIVTSVGIDWAIISQGGVSDVAMKIAEVALVASFGIAITKHRLYDIDVVFNKTLVFAGLATFITAIYAAVAVGIGSLVGGSSLWLAVAATAIIAVAFEPARGRMQRWANRVVYGKRATPYEVLSDINRRLAATESEEGMLERMASMLAAGTGATRATVWLTSGSGLVAAAASPGLDGLRVAAREDLPGEVEPITQEGELLGALTVEKDRGEAMTPIERELVADLAGSAALVLRKLRLDEALEAKAEELQASRRRLVEAQDVERQRLERDLHDGAQQQVVALKVKLGIAGQLAEREGAEKASALIHQMAGDTQMALEQIRSLARGIYPPLLRADGLAAAIPAIASVSPQQVDVHVEVSGRHPLPLEGAVYFCVSEALTNAAKHAAAPISVRVTDEGGELRFEVTDSGPGFDTNTVVPGAGLRNMGDRLDTLGGSLTVTSTPGGQTTIAGRLPLP